MNQNHPVPEYFVVEKSDGYYIYQNTIYKSPETNNVDASILWPVVNAKFGKLYRFNSNDEYKSVLTRSWIYRIYYTCKWAHVGKEIEMQKGNGMHIIVPVINIDNSYLPYNNKTMQPTENIPGIIQRRGIDIPARIYTIDPIDTVPIAAAKRNEMFPLHVAVQPVTVQPVTVQPVTQPSSANFTIPHHVKKLIITDSISRNECCPISCDIITETNACVTSCGHVFIYNEIKTWLSMESSKGLCPVCKQKCNI
jgi:hypothetical protein